MKQFTTLVFILITLHLHSQIYDDYIGAGQSEGITFISSDSESNGLAAMNGAGINLDMRGSSRFLAHATMGYTIEDVKSVTDTGIESWINNQIALPMSNYATSTVEVVYDLLNQCNNTFGEAGCEEIFVPNAGMWRIAWWDKVMKGDDLLRQRIALALSELLVISDQSELQNSPQGLAAYYDILYGNAFGNYKDILLQVTLNPSMGFYLSHINNPRTIPMQNTRPDENYAREIMQLFSVGLYELWNDGSRKIDVATGEWIPTYDNDDIKGLAKVFTGLSGSAWYTDEIEAPVQFGFPFQAYDLLQPMQMYELWHEPGQKEIIGGHIIEAGQSGMEDIEEAIDVLFNHDNVGPFLAKHLIQKLIKSNPSPTYIDRVASVFNDNGNGERGDMEAVIKSVLLDQEAYECFWIDNPTNGMLRSPLLRYTQMMKGLKVEMDREVFFNTGSTYEFLVGQAPLSAPSVFNFYSPSYVPNADFAFLNLVGPEYQIHNSSTSSNYVTYMLGAFMRNYLNERFSFTGTNQEIPNFLNGRFQEIYNPYDPDNNDSYEARFGDELWMDLGYSPADLIDYLDILMCNGSLSDDTRERLINSVSRADLFTPIDAAHYGAFMIMINPDFTVLK